MRANWLLCSLALLCGFGGAARCQEINQGVPRVSFAFERPGLPVPKYTLTVLDSGDAVYEGEETAPVSRGISGDSAPAPAPGRPFRQAVKLSPATTKRIFATAKTLKGFNVECASHLKNIADTGKKTLSFAGPEGGGACTYNYSENKSVTMLTDTFLGITETMDEGRRLDQLHRFDRLGLDAAMITLTEQVNAGRALELGTIAGTLRSIAGDGNVLQRVRMKASQLLSLLPPEMQQSTR